MWELGVTGKRWRVIKEYSIGGSYLYKGEVLIK